MTQTSTATRHARSIEHDGEGDDRTYTVSCACRTFYRNRFETFADAVVADQHHKAAVADGTWQAEQDTEAARLKSLAPLHAAQTEHLEAREARQSAAFGVIIAKQQGGDVTAARVDLEAAKTRFAAAEARLAEVQA